MSKIVKKNYNKSKLKNMFTFIIIFNDKKAP